MSTLLLGALLGIMLIGPVVVRVTPVEIDAPVSEARLRGTVARLCGEFAPRDRTNPGKLDRTADWIATRFEEAGLEVEFQSYEAGGGRFRNVIGRRTGTDPTAGVVVVGAHYDTVEGTPGADDNASGVAVLLELARTLPEHAPLHTQLFAAYSTEEPPFFRSEQMGSYVHAASLSAAGTPVSLMISLDSCGYFADGAGTQMMPWPGMRLLYPDRGNFIAIVGDLRSGPSIARVKRGMLAVNALPVHSFRASPRLAATDLSDHWSFRQFGFPAVQITDTAFMRHPHYHAAGDTADRLDYRRMAAVVRALHGVLTDRASE